MRDDERRGDDSASPCPEVAGEFSACRDGGADLVHDEPPQLLHAAAVSAAWIAGLRPNRQPGFRVWEGWLSNPIRLRNGRITRDLPVPSPGACADGVARPTAAAEAARKGGLRPRSHIGWMPPAPRQPGSGAVPPSVWVSWAAGGLTAQQSIAFSSCFGTGGGAMDEDDITLSVLQRHGIGRLPDVDGNKLASPETSVDSRHSTVSRSRLREWINAQVGSVVSSIPSCRVPSRASDYASHAIDHGNPLRRHAV